MASERPLCMGADHRTAGKSSDAAHRPLNVLYLAPASPGAQSLAAQSFIEEEIRSIRGWNVKPYIRTDELRGAITKEGIDVIGLPRLRSPELVFSFGVFALRHSVLLVRSLGLSWRAFVRVLHAMRLEHAAATLVRRQGIDILHSHFAWPGGFGGSLAARWTGVPLVASIRGTDVLVSPELNYGLRSEAAFDLGLHHLFPAAARILTATSFMRDATLALDAPRGKVRILDKGVDTETFVPPPGREDAKRQLELRGPVVLGVGDLKRRKRFDVVLDALSAMQADEWTLVICGGGEERARLEAKASALGLGPRVRFAGRVSRAQIPAYFAAADVFAHAAELEAAGNVVLEALASGCAVVCTDSGGPAEYVEDGSNGFVVPVGDVQALRHRLTTLLRRPDLRQRFAAEGRRRIEASHAYTSMMRDLRAIYDEVIQERRDSPSG